MNSGCEGEKKDKKSRKLPVLPNSTVQTSGIRKSKNSRRRAVSLIILQLLMIAHIIQWRITGATVSPIEPSETMFTLQNGAVNAGVIFFSLAILATLVFGRFVCGWGCHIVALQDFCAWLLKKTGITPKPFRSRLLIYVPLIVALYMFVWPTVVRFFLKPPDEPLIPQFTNHLITTEFWATFPPVWVAIPFLFICGFVTVYFLGSKGFCTYGCPYGGFFVLADKVAPGRIRVTDDCNQCGHCTATCMANVQVHAEVAKYGMVVDPGCMKHMDCISVCPNDALYFGFGKPSLIASAVGGARSAESNPKSEIRSPQLSWPEEIAAALVFTASYFAVWDVYQLVPMLMSLGIAIVTTFLVMRSWRLLSTPDAALHGFALKSGGKISRAGWIFLSFALLWVGWNAHSGFVRYHERAGSIAFESLQVPDELALAQADPDQWLTSSDRQNIELGKRHLYRAFDRGVLVNTYNLSKLAWIEFLSGNTEQALKLLDLAALRQDGRERALSFYYHGAILNRLKRHDEALVSLDQALATRPDLATAREEKGEALWQLGRRDEAIKAWNVALESNPTLPLANNFLAVAALSQDGVEAARTYEAQADQNTPDDPRFHWMLGLRLQNIGAGTEAGQLAEKHFTRASRLDPAFNLRRKFGSGRQ
ncbi:MAG: tetratricopeptide repeat protein [Pyrinomonadaceae bacterium]